MSLGGQLDTIPALDNNSFTHNFGRPMFSADGRDWTELLAVPYGATKTPGAALTFDANGNLATFTPSPALASGTISGTDLLLTMTDSSSISIDVSSLIDDTFISGGAFNSTTSTLDLTRTDNSGVSQTIQISAPQYFQAFASAALAADTTLRLTKFDNSEVDVALGPLLDGITLENTTGAPGTGIFQVKDLGITDSKLAPNSVTTSKILDGQVTEPKLASDSVSTAKIIDGNVTNEKLANPSINVSAGDASVVVANTSTNASVALGESSSIVVNVDGSSIEVDAANGVQIVDGGVNDSKLAANAVVDSKIAVDAVTESKIINDAITTTKIKDANVINSKLANPSINMSAGDNSMVVTNSSTNASVALGESSAIAVNVDGTTISIGTNGLEIAAAASTVGVTSGNTAIVSSVPSITLGGSTQLTFQGDANDFQIDATAGLQIKPAGVSNAQLENSTFGITSVDTQVLQFSGNSPYELGTSTQLTLNLDGTTITSDANGLKLTNNTIEILTGSGLDSTFTTAGGIPLGSSTTLSIVHDTTLEVDASDGLRIKDTSVTPGTYPAVLTPAAPGDAGPENATSVLQVVVNAKGQLTSVEEKDLSMLRDSLDGGSTVAKTAIVRCDRDHANANADPHIDIVAGATEYKFGKDNIHAGAKLIKGLADPIDNQDAVTKKYLYDRINGLAWMAPAQLGSTSPVNINTTLSDPFDGVALNTLTTPFRLLLTNQINAYDNGVWEYDRSSGTYTRPSDYDTGQDVSNKTILVEGGSLAGNIFSQVATPVDVGTSAVNDTNWIQITGGVVPTMTGATNLASGASGLVPAPVTGEHYEALLGNATFGHTEKIILQPSANSEVKFGTTSTGLTYQVAQTGDIALKRSGSLTSTMAVTEIKDNFNVNAPLLHVPGCAAITQHSTTSHAGLSSAHNVAGLYMGVHLTSKPYLTFTTEKTIGDENSSFVDFKHTDDTAYRARFQYLNAAQNTATDANYIPEGFTFIGTAKTSDTNWGLSVTAARETFAYNLTAFNSFYPSHPSGSGQIDIGSSTKMWKDVYASRILDGTSDIRFSASSGDIAMYRGGVLRLTLGASGSSFASTGFLTVASTTDADGTNAALTISGGMNVTKKIFAKGLSTGSTAGSVLHKNASNEITYGNVSQLVNGNSSVVVADSGNITATVGGTVSAIIKSDHSNFNEQLIGNFRNSDRGQLMLRAPSDDKIAEMFWGHGTGAYGSDANINWGLSAVPENSSGIGSPNANFKFYRVNSSNSFKVAALFVDEGGTDDTIFFDTRNVRPIITASYDIGSSTMKYKDIHLSSQIYQDPIIIGNQSDASDASTNTTAPISGQIAIGIGAKLLSSGTDDIVIGSRAACTGTSTKGWNVVMGPDAYSTGGNCIVIGEASGADGDAFGAIAMGYQAYAWDKAVNIAGKDMMHKGDVVIGYGSGGWQPTNSNDSKFASVCIGYSSSAKDNSISIGDRTQALGEGCILLGSNARITQGTSTLLIAGSPTPATGTLESSMPFPNSFGGYGLLNGDGSPVNWDPEFSGDPHANYGDNCIVIDMSNTGSTYSTLTGKTNNVLVGGNLTVNDLDKSILIGHKITAHAKTTSIVLNASDSTISIGDSVDNNADNGRCYIAPIRQRTADENDVNIMYDSVNKELVSVQGQFLSPTGSRLGTPSEFTLREVQNNNTAPYAGFVGWNPGFTQNGITGWFQSMATFYPGIPGVEFGNYTTSLQVDDELEMTYNDMMGEHTVATVFVASIPNDNSFNVKDANGVVLNDAALSSLGFLQYQMGLEYEPKVTRAGTPDLSAPTRNILYPRWDYSTKEFGWDDMLLLYGATSGSLMLQAADTTSSYAIQFPAAGGSARKRLEISTVTTGTSETCQLEWTDRVYLPNNVVEEVHTSGTFEVGKWYEIVDPGTTDFFTEQNADGNFPTIQFQAITAGTGTGTARNLPMIVSLVSGHGVGTPNTDSYHIGFPVDVSNVQVGQVLQISGITTAGGYLGTKVDLEFADASGNKFNALYVDNTSYFDDQSTTITGGHDISSALLIRRGSEVLSEQTAGVYPYTMVECHAVHHDHVDDSNNETTAQNNANALGSIINESNLFGFTNIKFKTTQSGSGAVGGSSVAAFPVVTYIASGHGYFNSSDPTDFNKTTDSHDRRRDSNIAFFTSRDNADLGSGDNQNSELNPKLAMLISPDGRVGIGGAKNLKGVLQISQRHGDANVVTRNRAVPFIAFTGSDTDAKANTVIGDISRSGESSVVYNTSSDYRVKKNVTDFSGGLGVVNALLPKSFNFIDDLDESKKTIGFLAHEVSPVTNGVITGEKDAIDEDGSPILQKIDHSKLVPYLVSAVKELSAANQALMARVASLEEAIKISSQP